MRMLQHLEFMERIQTFALCSLFSKCRLHFRLACCTHQLSAPLAQLLIHSIWKDSSLSCGLAFLGSTPVKSIAAKGSIWGGSLWLIWFSNPWAKAASAWGCYCYVVRAVVPKQGKPNWALSQRTSKVCLLIATTSSRHCGIIVGHWADLEASSLLQWFGL